MKLKEIEWKKQTGKFQNGIDATIGGIKIGSVDWDGIHKREEKYIPYCLLPGFKSRFENELTQKLK